MDQSILVGLITGTASVPQDDLSLESKATVIFFAHDTVRNEMENLVTKGFQPFHEFASVREGRRVAYNCAFPDAIAGARIGLMFTTDTPMTRRQDGCSVEFVRHSVLITTKGDLFWLAEKCVNVISDNPFRSVWDVVTNAGIAPLDCKQLRHYLGLFPELFLRLLTNFRAIAEHAFEMRRQRQERTQKVLDELTRINNMVGLVKFV